MSAPIPSKVCVGRKVGQGAAYLPTQDEGQWGSRRYQVRVVGYYDQLTLLPAQKSANVIDVYIDNARYQRVRW